MMRKVKQIKKEVVLKLILLISFSGTFLSVFSQIVSNKGKDFWVGYGHHQYMEQTSCGSGPVNNNMNMRIYLSNTETQTATVTVTLDRSGILPSQWYKKTYTIPPNTVIETENMPKGPIDAGPSASNANYDARLWSDPPPFSNGGEQVFQKKGIHIESTIPIVAYAHIYGGVSSGATMLIPTEAWGYSYTSINSEQGGNVINSFSWMYLIAKDSNTVVEITPSQVSRLGKPAGVPFQITLQKGEIYQLIGSADCVTGAGVQLTGTTVRSISNGLGDCKQIAVFSGSSRTGGEAGFCGSSGRDNDMQQCYPQQAWGKRYLTAPFSKSSSGTLQPTSFQNNVFKIAVKDPTTVVKRNGVTLNGIINNSYYAYTSNTADYIETDKPVMIAQFMSNGSNCNSGDGDPEMVFLSPIEQAIKRVGFYRTNLQAILSNYITIIVPTAGVASLRIDNSSVFNHTYPHPNKAGYTVVIKGWPAAKSQGIVTCDSAFTAITYGMGSAESYGYNAGAQLNNLSGLPGYHNTPDTSASTVIHPYTYLNTPVQIGAYIAYKPTQMVWKLTSIGCSIVTPCADVTVVNPVPIDSILIGAAKYYLYRLPGNYTFSQSGTFYLTIDLTSPNADNGNCNNKETVQIEIIVKPKPTSVFTYTQTVGCGVDSVRFQSGASTPESYTIIKRKWTFTNAPADTSNLQNPVFYFPTAGVYPVKLSITTLYGGIADTTINVTVSAGSQPNSKFGANPQTVCLGQAIVFSDSTNYSGTTGWYWDFGNGQTLVAATNVNQTITYATAGSYIVKHTLQGSFTCAADTVSKTVVVAATPNITGSSSTSPTNCGGADGTISLTGLLANTTYLVNYTFNSIIQTPTITSNASGILIITGLSIGNYTSISVKIGNCTSNVIATVTVSNPPAPVTPIAGSNTPVCAGAEINLTSSTTTTGAIIYAWTGPNGFTSSSQNPTISNVTTAAAGTYSVTATLNGCTSIAGSATVVVSAIPQIGSTSSTNPTTCGTSTGTITLNGLLSNTAYVVKYTINSVIQTVTITSSASGAVVIGNLALGTYSNVTVALNTCTSNPVGPFVLSDPNPPATPVAGGNSPICAGATINLSATSSTNGVTYNWTGPNSFISTSQNPNITNATTAATGIYTVTANLNGCTSISATTTIVVNAIPAIPTATSNSPICAGATLNLTANTTTSGVTYNWTGPNSFVSNAQNPNITNATTAASGTYNVSASLNGCTSNTATVTVAVNALPVISSTATTNPTTCATSTGSISLNGLLGSTSYVVNYTVNTVVQTTTITSNASGTVVITSLPAGTYSNISVSLNGCISSSVGPLVLSEPNPPATPVASSNTPVCSGSTLNLTASSTTTGVSYTWTGPNGFTNTTQNPSISNVTIAASGVYSVTASLNSCTSIAATTTVVIKATPVVSSSSSNNPTSCATATGSIVLNGLSPNILYTVNYTKNSTPQTVSITTDASGTLTITNLSAATYANVTITLNGCTSTAVGPFTLSDPNPPATPVATSNSPLCNGSTLNLTATSSTSGVSYNWTGPNAFASNSANPSIANATPAASGTYNVTATLNSCTSVAGSVVVVVNATPIISSFSSTNPPNCSASTGSITLNGLTPNTSYTVNYTQNAVPQTATISSNASGAIIITSLPAGTYTNITVTIGICPSNSVGPITLTDPAAPATPVITSNAPLCEGATLNLNANSSSNGISYAWTSTNGFNSNSQNISIPNSVVANSGTYTVTVTLNNCTSTANSVVVINPIPVVNFSTPAFVCMPNGVVNFTNQTTVSGNGTLSYVWEFGDASPNSTATNATHTYSTIGPYIVKLTATSNGCSNFTTKTFSAFYDKPIAAFKIDKDTICQGVTSKFTDESTAPNSTIANWTWNFGDGSPTTNIGSPTKLYNQPGIYDVTLVVKNTQGCESDILTKKINVYLQPVIDAGPSFVVAQGSTVIFNPITNDSTTVTFSWTPAIDFTNPNILRPSLLVLKSQKYTVTAKGQGKCEASDTLSVVALKKLIIPNAFSPNGDGINDRWEIQNLGDYVFATVEVFNRYGQLLYKSNGYSIAWDGTYNGKSLPVGTYYYIIDFKDSFPKQSGYVVILR